MELNDFELIYMAHQNNEDAHKLLIDKYTSAITHVICQKMDMEQRKYLFEDAFQEASAMLFNSVDSYRDDSGIKFFTFSILCIDRKLSDILRKVRRGTYLSVSELSLDAPLDKNTNGRYVDLVEDLHYEYQPEEYLKAIFLKDELLKAADKLEEKERKIYMYQSLGYDYKRIAELTDTTSKNVDYLLRKARKKLKNELKLKEND